MASSKDIIHHEVLLNMSQDETVQDTGDTPMSLVCQGLGSDPCTTVMLFVEPTSHDCFSQLNFPPKVVGKMR